jgi:hypothetical protein
MSVIKSVMDKFDWRNVYVVFGVTCIYIYIYICVCVCVCVFVCVCGNFWYLNMCVKEIHRFILRQPISFVLFNTMNACQSVCTTYVHHVSAVNG